MAFPGAVRHLQPPGSAASPTSGLIRAARAQASSRSSQLCRRPEPRRRPPWIIPAAGCFWPRAPSRSPACSTTPPAWSAPCHRRLFPVPNRVVADACCRVVLCIKHDPCLLCGRVDRAPAFARSSASPALARFPVAM